jgi:hypothetical protein
MLDQCSGGCGGDGDAGILQRDALNPPFSTCETYHIGTIVWWSLSPASAGLLFPHFASCVPLQVHRKKKSAPGSAQYR